MSQPTRRKASGPPTRARRDSARLSADGPKKSTAGTPVRTQSSPKASAQSKKSRKAPAPKIGATPLWTKSTPKKSSSSLFLRILGGIGSFFLLVITSLFKGLRTVIVFIASLIARSKVAIALTAVLAIALVGGVVDLGLNWGKVYPGVTIGGVEASGMTAEEVQKMVEDTYSTRLSNTTIYIFANEEASKDLEASLAQTNDAAYAEEHSVEEVQARKLVWEATAGSLGATLATKDIVDEALSYGRENGGLIARISALFSGYAIEPRAHYNTDKIEELAHDIDMTIGDPRVNFDIALEEGVASIVEGHDGDMIERSAFLQELNTAFLQDPTETVSLVAQTEYAPLQITREEAQRVCDLVNTSLSFGAQFVYNASSWDATSADLGNWLKTEVSTVEDGWELRPYLDYDTAKGTLVNHLKASFSEDTVRVHFSVEGDTITVKPESSGSLPQTKKALETLNTQLFESEEALSSKPTVEVGSTSIPDSMSLQDALDAGVISTISEFTTEYATGAENRNHNIHLAADLIGNSVIKANGGEWSFNETAGEATEEAGYKGAGTILDGEIVDDIGGGICQVATTVFNSVYNAGYPVLQRNNHSLYIASYPLGLDAAVSYPYLDLKWKNDTSSDVLLATSYTDYSVTVTLYGVDPEYQVSTETGNWEPDEKYKTKTITDDDLTPGTSYVKTVGIDGSKISVHQTVKDKQGNLLHETTFTSYYTPRDEVIVEGPKVEEKAPEGTNSTEPESTEPSEPEDQGSADQNT